MFPVQTKQMRKTAGVPPDPSKLMRPFWPLVASSTPSDAAAAPTVEPRRAVRGSASHEHCPDKRSNVPLDPADTERLREQFAALQQLHHAAASRAGSPPRLSPDAWRGDAYLAYAADAESLAAELTSIATEIAGAERIARTELAHALA